MSVVMLQYILGLVCLNTVSYGFINALRVNWMQHGLHAVNVYPVFSVSIWWRPRCLTAFFSKQAEMQCFGLDHSDVSHLPGSVFF